MDRAYIFRYLDETGVNSVERYIALDAEYFSDVKVDYYGVVQHFTLLRNGVSTRYHSTIIENSYSTPRKFEGYITKEGWLKSRSGGYSIHDKRVKANRFFPYSDEFAYLRSSPGRFVQENYVDETGVFSYNCVWELDGLKFTPPFRSDDHAGPIPVVMPADVSAILETSESTNFSYSPPAITFDTTQLGPNESIDSTHSYTIGLLSDEEVTYYIAHANTLIATGDGVLVLIEIIETLRGLQPELLALLESRNLWQEIPYSTLNMLDTLEPGEKSFSAKMGLRRNLIKRYKKVLDEVGSVDDIVNEKKAKDIYDLMIPMSVDQLWFVPVEHKVEMLRKLSHQKLNRGWFGLGIDEESLVIKIVKSILIDESSAYADIGYDLMTGNRRNASLFLARLIDLEPKVSYHWGPAHYGGGYALSSINGGIRVSQKSIFKELFEQLFDTGCSLENAEEYIRELYKVWRFSFFCPYDETRTHYLGLSDSVEYDHFSFIDYVDEDADEEVWKTPPVIEYESATAMGFYTNDLALDFKDNGRKIRLYQSGVRSRHLSVEEIASSGYPAYYNTNLTGRNPFVKYESYFEDYGTHSIYQPVTLFWEDGEHLRSPVKMQLDQNGEPDFETITLGSGSAEEVQKNFQTLPLFVLKFMDKAGNAANFFTGLELAFDIVSTVTGIGGLLKLRHLGKLRYLVMMRNAGYSVRVGTAFYYARHVINGIEISAGVANILIKIAWNNCLSEDLQVNTGTYTDEPEESGTSDELPSPPGDVVVIGDPNTACNQFKQVVQILELSSLSVDGAIALRQLCKRIKNKRDIYLLAKEEAEADNNGVFDSSNSYHSSETTSGDGTETISTPDFQTNDVADKTKSDPMPKEDGSGTEQATSDIVFDKVEEIASSVPIITKVSDLIASGPGAQWVKAKFQNFLDNIPDDEVMTYWDKFNKTFEEIKVKDLLLIRISISSSGFRRLFLKSRSELEKLQVVANTYTDYANSVLDAWKTLEANRVSGRHMFKTVQKYRDIVVTNNLQDVFADHPQFIEIYLKADFGDASRMWEKLRETDFDLHEKLDEYLDTLSPSQMTALLQLPSELITQALKGRKFEMKVHEAFTTRSGVFFDTMMEKLAAYTQKDTGDILAQYDAYRNWRFTIGEAINLGDSIKGKTFIPDVTLVKWKWVTAADDTQLQVIDELIMIDAKLNIYTVKTTNQGNAIASGGSFGHFSNKPKLLRSGDNYIDDADYTSWHGLDPQKEIQAIVKGSGDLSHGRISPEFPMARFGDGDTGDTFNDVTSMGEFGTPHYLQN